MEYIISLKYKVKVLIDRFNNKQEKQFIILATHGMASAYFTPNHYI